MKLTPEQQELFDEACRRYPVGTKFRVVHYPDRIRTVASHQVIRSTFVNNSDNGLHLNLKTEYSKENEEKGAEEKGATVYLQGRWAKIVSYPDNYEKEESIKELFLKIDKKIKSLEDEKTR